ncbi:MAG: aminotransferase class I/II-fold pyridoxal phosphate-dependent enzyme [Candidatus Omnitrophica bacterium]|nr:aminotransferase class I/II-fold pyridoxal phosphate-dependent enzyme [Candidatus Omnitrophota bacterium]
MKREIYLDAPNVGALEKKYLSRAVDSGYVSTIGPFVDEFEMAFAKCVQAPHATAVQSGTGALHVALHELGIGKGDEVIVPALTFVATINPILYVGAKPVFADVDPETWTINPKDIEGLMTKKTKAVLPVHLYGNPCNMPAIMRVARRYDLAVIEDATESLGAFIAERQTGTWGDLGCFSFNGNKVITTGGGGMVVGNDATRLKHIKFLVNQARDISRGYYHGELGFNYRMTNVEAALGIAQLRRLSQFTRKKKMFSDIYRKNLEALGGIQFQKQYPTAQSSYWLNCLTVPNRSDVETLQSTLKSAGVQTRRVFMPASEFPYLKAYKRGALPHSYDIYERGLCLPASTVNSEKDIHYVCQQIKKVF